MRFFKLSCRCILAASFLLVATALYAQSIYKAEYFIDADPGAGNGTAIIVSTPGSAVNFNFTVPTTSLTAGFHVLGARTKQTISGRWSHAMYQSFYIVPSVVSSPATNLTRAEYFIDADPGNGNGINLPIAVAPTVNTSFAVPLTGLPPGFHTLHARTRDNRGRWAISLVQSFYIVSPPVVPGSINLTKAEYFFDADPGSGNGTPLSISPAALQTNTLAIPVTGLSAGFHSLSVRYKDNSTAKSWSHSLNASFYVINAALLPAQNLKRLEYFIDVDPGYGSGTGLAFTSAPTINGNFSIDLSGIASGNHQLQVRVQNDKGLWSDVISEPFTISTCTPPSLPVVNDQLICGPGTLTFTASGAIGSQEYRWYDDPIAGNLVYIGDSFTTPTLTTTTNYYTVVFDPVTLCESSRKTVKAEVISILKPALNLSGTVSVCEGSSLLLTAPAGYAQYLWSNGETTDKILVTAQGDYSVQIGNSSCLSPSSDVAVVDLLASPPKPLITVSGNTIICEAGSVLLTAPAGFEYSWSNGATTESITVSQTGVFFVRVKSIGQICLSIASDPVAVSILPAPCNLGGNNPPPTFVNKPPVVNSSPVGSQIEGRVQLDMTKIVSDPDNNLDFSTLRVINNETSRGVNAFIDASYILQINYAGTAFAGADRVTIEVCDLAGACVQQVIEIEVVGEVLVFNGITPDNDGFNDFMQIKYVDVIAGAAENNVTIFNRWGDKVFEINNYNNYDRVFNGYSNSGKELPAGTYFYRIELSYGPVYSGFVTLKR